jgi:hypothetical protein
LMVLYQHPRSRREMQKRPQKLKRIVGSSEE